jgi:taurine dioxygenase
LPRGAAIAATTKRRKAVCRPCSIVPPFARDRLIIALGETAFTLLISSQRKNDFSEEAAMAFDIHKVSPSIGVEIRGLDTSIPVDAATVRDLRRAWQFDGAGLMLFRGQKLDKDQQRAFCSLFGTIGVRAGALPTTRPRAHEGPDYNSDSMLVSNIRKDGKPIGVLPDGELWFHHDMCYSATPNRASFLYSIEVPKTGGDTMFCNMYAAYENLPQRLKDAIEGRRVLQAFDEVQDRRLDLSQVPVEDVKHAWQPMVLRHPETGRRALYVSRLMSHLIEGMSEAESAKILEELYDYTEAPEVKYTHRWAPGDLLMWDNLCSIHARTDFPKTERRLMRRFTISGEAVIPAWEAQSAA